MKARVEFRDFLFFLLKLALIVYAVRILIVSPFNIPSESMQPRLLIGDYLLWPQMALWLLRYSIPYATLPVEGRLLARTRPSAAMSGCSKHRPRPARNADQARHRPARRPRATWSMAPSSSTALPCAEKTHRRSRHSGHAQTMTAASDTETCPRRPVPRSGLRAERPLESALLPLSALPRDTAQWQKLRRARPFRQRDRQQRGL